MPARRRQTQSRSSSERTRLWDKKMSGEIYSTLLPELKKLAIDKVASYQATHEHLIATVKQILQDSPEAPLLHEYMWYAEKLWKLTQTYKSNALQLQADALYLWHLARGRNDITLRMVARALGIKISALEEILERVAVPALIKVISKGSTLSSTQETVILEYTGQISTISGYIDLSNMDSDDQIIVRAYVKLKEDGDYKLYRPETFIGKQTEPALYILPRVSGYAYKVTIQQTAGTPKNLDYLFIKGV
jgi:hypothetical protein